MSDLFPLRVGELAYLNTLPFRQDPRWTAVPCPTPRLLATWANDGRVDAGVIPVVEAWKMTEAFEPVGALGIAAKKHARSVCLFSKVPWDGLAGTTVGVTDHTSTSVLLLRVLLANRFGIGVDLRDRFSNTDTARLVIGDDALMPTASLVQSFPHVLDLAEEWFSWQKAPFVFARWMVRKSIAPYWREQLKDALTASLALFDNRRKGIARELAKTHDRPAAFFETYFSGLTYTLGDREANAESEFRDLVFQLDHVRC